MRLIFKNLLVYFLVLIASDTYSQCAATISVFPYNESFEGGPSNWTTGGTNNDWTWGSPTKAVITGAGAGVNCWITGGLTASFYSYGESSWVESPCFDFTSVNSPYVSFLIFWDTERTYDGGNLQYSIDGGASWKSAGSFSDAEECNNHNWFNITSVQYLNGLGNNSQGWSGSTQTSSGGCSGGFGSGEWKRASHCLKELANKPVVKFRFTFGSGTQCNNYDGMAFDDFYIGPAPSITDNFSFACTAHRTLTFNDSLPDCHDHWSWNFDDPSSTDNVATGNNVTHEFTAGGFYNVTLSTGGECSVDTQITRSVRLLLIDTVLSTVTCIGDSDGTAQVNVSNATVNTSFQWSHDQVLNSPFAIGLKEGYYRVIVTDPGSCVESVDININYGPYAYPEIELGNDTTLCPGSEILLEPGHFTTYQWQDNSTDSFFVVKGNGKYQVFVSNDGGCTTSDSLFIKEDCLQDVVIPNAFTPNGDGSNELFFVDGSETYEYKIYIFDRWGQVIFSSDNRMEGWDGKSNNGHPAKEGVYTYLVNYSVDGVEEKSKTGSVFLIR